MKINKYTSSVHFLMPSSTIFWRLGNSAVNSRLVKQEVESFQTDG